MNVLDGIIAIALVLFALQGFKNGLAKEVIGLIGLIIAFFLAFRHMHDAAFVISDLTGWTSEFLPLISFFVVFLLIIIITHLVIKSVEKLLEVTFLSFTNKIFGLVFGVLKCSILISLFLIVLAGFNFPNDDHRQTSFFYSYMLNAAPITYNLIAEVYPHTENFADSIRRTMEDYNIELFR